MKIKELFDKAENGTLTYEQFEALSKEADVKFVDLNEGNFVSKRKYEDELSAKAKEIELLNGTIGSRDTDLADLQKQLQEAGDGYLELEELRSALTDLQGKYEDDTKTYKQQLQDQAYEFAANRFADTWEFTSAAAKREFVRAMMDAGLKMDKKGEILGKQDFADSYKEENADSFVVKSVDPTPAQDPQPAKAQPQFVGSTPGTVAPKPLSLTEMMKAANDNPGLTIQ